MILTVGTRRSKLSLIQTEQVIQELKAAHPAVEFKVKVIATLGDTERGKPLFTIDSKGIFEKEIDQAIVNGEVDFAVASLKDVPTVESAGTVTAAIPQRASPRDALVSRGKLTFKALPEGAVIGTGSLRRLAEVKFLRPDLEVKPIRGNVDTRIQKVQKDLFDGLIVAEAGLERMGLESLITERFSLDQFPPAPGQGALAVIAKKDNWEIIKLLRAVEHKATRAEITAERNLMLQLGGGCRMPVGAVGHADGKHLSLEGFMFKLDGANRISAIAEGTVDEAENVGKQVAESLLKQGGRDIEREWREKYGSG